MLNPHRGFYLGLEGLDGCGKDTQLELLKEKLEAQGLEVVVVNEPGTTIVGQQLRQILKHTEEQLDPITELFLFYASRRQTIMLTVLPALEAGKIVLSNRSYWTSEAYQRSGLQAGHYDSYDIDQIFASLNSMARKYHLAELSKELGDECFEYLCFDRMLFFDIEPQVALDRAKHRSGHDRIEKNPIEYFERAAENYRRLAKGSEVATFDASRTIEEIHNDVWACVSADINYWRNNHVKDSGHPQSGGVGSA